MALRANTVNRNSRGDPFVDVSDHTCGDLRVVGDVEVVIVDVELSGRVGGASGAEGNANEVLAEHAAENAIPEATVLGKDLVDNVPLDDLAFVVGHNVGYVVLNNGRQGGTVVDLADPRRQLRVPEERVATNVFSVLLGPGNDFISVAVAETSTGCCIREKLVWNTISRLVQMRAVLTLNGIPLHAVLGRYLSKAVLGDSQQGVVVEMVLVNLSAEVGFAFGDELRVQPTG
jgi:hypothetical protein